MKVSLRGDMLTVQGTPEAVIKASQIAQRMIDTARQRGDLDPDDVPDGQVTELRLTVRHR